MNQSQQTLWHINIFSDNVFNNLFEFSRMSRFKADPHFSILKIIS